MEPFLAQIFFFAGDFIPRNFHACNGSLLKVEQYPQLFQLIGNDYGGDGIRFALPKIEPIKNIGTTESKGNYIICIKGLYPVAN